jgi:hypothetical protein
MTDRPEGNEGKEPDNLDIEEVIQNQEDDLSIEGDFTDDDPSFLDEDDNFEMVEENDFDESFLEDGAFEDNQDFEDSHSHSDEKTTFNWLNVAIVSAVIVVIGGLIYGLLFSSGQNQPNLGSAPVMPAAVETVQPVEEAKPLTLEEQIIEKGGLLSNLDLLQDESNQVNLVKQEEQTMDVFADIDNSANTLSDDDVDDLFDAIRQLDSTNNQQDEPEQDILPEDTLPVPMDSLQDNMAEQNILPSLPDIDILEFLEESISEPELAEQAVETEVVLEEELSQEPNEFVSQLGYINSQMQSMDVRLDDLSKQLREKSQSVAVTPMDAGNNEVIQQLQNRINDLEKKLNQTSQVKRPVAEPRKTPKRTARAPAPKPKKTWELKGASPGKAFIAEKGTDNLQTIHVNDFVDGIGIITSIRLENGQWVVRASEGTIRQ